MMWDYGYGMGWGWILILFGLLALAALIVLVVRSFTAGSSGPPGSPPSHGQPPRTDARAIAEERLARGEITPDEYREIRRALDETIPPAGG
ncbi:SHOCT domain-containing protein [Agromyces bauzanensis]